MFHEGLVQGIQIQTTVASITGFTVGSGVGVNAEITGKL